MTQDPIKQCPKTLNNDQLRAAIEQAQQDVIQYERMKTAKARLDALLKEGIERTQAEAKAKAEFEEAEIARWNIESVHKTDSAHEGLLASHTVSAIDKHGGERRKFSLAKAPRPVVAAVARDPKKIPIGILKLGDTPQAALERWILSANRGYVAG